MCHVFGPRWRAIHLAVMVSSSRLCESRRGRTDDFRDSPLGTRWCMFDRAVFAGVNPTGKRLYDGVMLSICRRRVWWCEPHRRETVCWLQVLVSVHVRVACLVLHSAVSPGCLVLYSAVSLVLSGIV